ncbi:2'-5' RNA ligase family protein [Embleya sp. NPDC005575]|uniref:2'-5' RNA ligase family protein n=1 Tax=Embleya sp. NPDC005575 TaxID=3156892 RepID=UPI0033AFC75F
MRTVELTLDGPTESAVRRVWEELAELGLPGQGLRPSAANRPHLTLGTCHELTDSMRESLAEAFTALPLEVEFTRPVRFGGRSRTVAWEVSPTDALLALQLRVWRVIDAQNPYHHPAVWVPHVTLARTLRPGDAWQERAWRLLQGRPAVPAVLIGARSYDHATDTAEDLPPADRAAPAGE